MPRAARLAQRLQRLAQRGVRDVALDAAEARAEGAPQQRRLAGVEADGPRVEDASMQALDMVNLSSELLRIETGRFQVRPERVAVGHLLADASAPAVAWVERRSLQVRLDLPEPAGAGPWAAADKGLCRSVLHDLLRNACEAAPTGSTVTLSARRDAADATVTLRVHNEGAVPLDARERFFDRHVTSGKRRGTGLGTCSARLLTEAQGGRIAMSSSDETADTTVTFELPAR